MWFDQTVNGFMPVTGCNTGSTIAELLGETQARNIETCVKV